MIEIFAALFSYYIKALVFNALKVLPWLS